MRQGQQHRRGRGRNNVNNNHPGNRKGQNPLTRSFESNGPDVKVRGTPAHIAEKYMQLARDAQSSGDHVLAENYLQHAEHYNRIILAYREQQIQQSGEMLNGSSRHHHQPSRQDFQDGDDAASESGGASDDTGALEQPSFVRHPGDQPRDVQPAFDEPRHQRHDQPPRFRERHSRGERHERQHDRQDGFERDRGERSEHGGERFERQRERPFRQADQSGEPREMRMHREPREHRQPQDARRETPQPSTVEGASGEDAPAPARSEAPSRRRERFGLGEDQPAFLRRPVRRPRRDAEQEFTPEPTSETAPSADETPRE
ncbi:MAG: DUF4167 domain-containing protein [Hyphomicrobiaceae bacterium]